MSKSNITLSGKTLWYADQPFAFWLRVMALNLEGYRCDDYAWTSEHADAWMHTTRMLGVSNVMGVDLDTDFGNFQKAWILHNIVQRVREIFEQLDDETIGLVAQSLGLNVSCSIEEIKEIHHAVDALLVDRLEFLRAESNE